MDPKDTILSRLRDLYGRLTRVSETKPLLVEELVVEFLRLHEQEHRHYHNLTHLLECIVEFNDAFSDCDNPTAAEMALLYHDIVYEPTSSGNEQLSANKAVFDCMRLDVDRPFQGVVSKLITATCHTDELSGDAAIVADIDLSILGRPWERFTEYEMQIRQEYKHVTDKDFVTGRSLVLDGFLRRPRIFQTDRFRDKYEKTARANIALSLMKLRAPHA